MFGYIKPFEPNLLVKELELYKAAYCGMCRALKKYVSPLMPLSLNYDFVLLAIMRMALQRTPPKIEKKRCAASPFKKKCRLCAADNLSLRYAAQAGALLTYYNLKDEKLYNDTCEMLELAAEEDDEALADDILNEERAKQQITQEELALRVGTQKSNISRLESGTYNPSLDFLIKVAHSLGKKMKIVFE